MAPPITHFQRLLENLIFDAQMKPDAQKFRMGVLGDAATTLDARAFWKF